MGILRVSSDYFTKVNDCVFVPADVLESLGPLVDVYNGWVFLDTPGERKDGLLELLQAGIGQADVVEDVRCNVSIRVALQRPFEIVCDFIVLGISVRIQAELVEHCRVEFIQGQCLQEAFTSHIVLTHGVETPGLVPSEFHVIRLF